MNAQRRKALKDCLDRLQSAYDILCSTGDDINTILEEEQDAYDNFPDSLKETERGERMQECIDLLENVTSLDCIDTIEEMMESIEEVIG